MISRDGRSQAGSRPKPVIARTQRELEEAYAVDSRLHPIGHEAANEHARAKRLCDLVDGGSEQSRRAALRAVNHARLIAAEWGLAGKPV